MAPTPEAWLTTDEVLAAHELVVASSEVTEPGVRSREDVAYAVEASREGPFGRERESLHAAAFQLLRLLVANHPFVDGNKRTALAATVATYALHDRSLDYDRDLKTILKRLGTDETAVDGDEVAAYLAAHSRASSGTTAGDGTDRREHVGRVVRRDMAEHAAIYEELARE